MTRRDDASTAPSAPARLQLVDGGATTSPTQRPVLVVSADGTVVGVDAALCALVGRPAADLLGSAAEHVVASGTAQVLAAVAAGRTTGRTVLRLVRVDRRERRLAVDWTAVHVAGGLQVTLSGSERPDTAGAGPDASRAAAETRLRAVADTAEEGIWAVGTDGTTLWANARAAALLGVPHRLPFAAEALDRAEPEAAARLRERLVAAAGSGPERVEVPYAHPDGQERRLRVSTSALHDDDGGLLGRLAMVTDVTDLRRAQEQARTSSVHDGLTGLPNRALLLDRLQQAVGGPARSTALLVVDLDGFALVNDSRGHRAGDELLVAVARRLVDVVGPPSTVARTGPDEFVVLAEGCDASGARELAQAVVAALHEPFAVAGAVLHVGACIGVATTGPAVRGATPPSATDVLRAADTAVHAAKATGPGRVRVFDPALSAAVADRSALAADLRAALADDALSLHYQPVVRLASGDVVGMEALARWTHPERGPVPPATFVAVAELTGLSEELDRWVVRRALHDAGVLHAARAVPPGTYVAVNLSARSLASGWLDRDLPGWAAAAGLSPEQVLLEITETSVMQDAEQAIGVLRALREQGFGVAVDDFGTGYSSLAYLRDLPITTLKVDRSFVTGLSSSVDALAIVASVVDLARAVGVAVIAEGVETPEQSALLQRLGCVDGQGWLWSPAVPAGRLLAERPWLRPVVAEATGAPAGPLAARPGPGPVVTAEHGLVRLLGLHRSGASLTTIASALNSEGFRTPSGARWHRTSVARAITDAAYPLLDDLR